MDPFSIAFGVANAASGIFGAIGSQQATNAQTRATNNALRRQYKEQLKIRRMQAAQTNAIFGQKKIQFQQQLGYNNRAAGFAYIQEQNRLNELYKQHAFTNQGDSIELAQQMGKLQATEQSGKSAQRNRTMLMASFGRNEAIQAEVRDTARSAYKFNTMRIRDRLKQANEMAYNDVAIPPTMPLLPEAPVFKQYSNEGLYSGIGNSLIGGVQSAFTASKGEWFK